MPPTVSPLRTIALCSTLFVVVVLSKNSCIFRKQWRRQINENINLRTRKQDKKKEKLWKFYRNINEGESTWCCRQQCHCSTFTVAVMSSSLDWWHSTPGCRNTDWTGPTIKIQIKIAEISHSRGNVANFSNVQIRHNELLLRSFVRSLLGDVALTARNVLYRTEWIKTLMGQTIMKVNHMKRI